MTEEELLEKVMEVFQNKESAETWINSHCMSLSDTPINAIKLRGGVEQVQWTLDTIRVGNFS